MDWLTYANQGAVRSQPLSDELIRALSFLPDMGLGMEVFSGGQPAYGSGKPRVGSTRHDHGNAADVFFTRDGQRLDWSSPNDRPIFEDIVRRAKAAGVTGIGAGEGYMQPGSMHIGFGNEAVWGAGGKGANAPDWLRNAYYGGGQDIADETMIALGREPIRPQPAPQPQGILSTQSEEPDVQNQMATGLFGALFPNMTADRQDRIAMALSGLSMNPNMGAMQMVRDRMDQRASDRKEAKAQQKAQETRNKTAEYIATRLNRPDLAQAVMQGILTGAQAYAEATKPGTKPDWEWNSDIGQYVDMNDPTNTMTPQGAGGTSPSLTKDQFNTLDKISDDARRDLSEAEMSRDAFQRIESFSRGQGPVSDVALVTAFAKVLDPGSVVRSDEAATIANSGALTDGLKATMLNALNGTGALPESVRQEIYNLSRSLYYDTASNARETIGNYQERAERAGVGGERVYMGSDFTSPAQPQTSLRPRSMAQGAPPVTSSLEPDAAPTEEELRSAISGLSPYDQQLLQSIPGAQAKIQFLREKGVLQ